VNTILSLDIGKRKTGCALGYLSSDCIIALSSLRHNTIGECVDGILAILQKHQCQTVILGLPRLPQGEEGSQAEYVRDVGNALQKKMPTIELVYIDERFTSSKEGFPVTDDDARAACTILEIEMSRRKKLLTSL
jgi:putative Holliday junction resolvase